MVAFIDSQPPATKFEIDDLERRLGLPIPARLRHQFLAANGGRPEPDVYGDPRISTDVSECLALSDSSGGVWSTYTVLGLSKNAFPSYCLPFAVDSGGNSFVVDCRPGKGQVYFLTHDPVFELNGLDVDLEGFWARMTDE